MNAQTIGAPRFGFSLQWIDADARQVDWSELSLGDDYDAILPVPTCADVREHAPELADSWFPGGAEPDGGWSSALTDDEAEEFEDSDGWQDWRDGFAPMMNYAWPVSLAYDGPDAATAAGLIERFAPACVLIELQDDARERLYGDDRDAPEYAIALTGGGMDLSDDIAAAYLACGCVPPSRLLAGLSGVISPEKAVMLPLREAYERAADHLEFRAERMRKECARIHGDPEPRAMLAADLGLESAL